MAEAENLSLLAHTAARNGDFEKLKRIFENPNFDVNQADGEGLYPVEGALLAPYPSGLGSLQNLDSKQGQILKLFIKKGADLNVNCFPRNSFMLQFIKNSLVI